MTALIVRSEPGAGDFVRRLAREGVPAVACPVTTMHPLDTAFSVPETAQGVAFTSVNAVRFYAGRSARTDLPAYAVGAATAAAAKAAGFTVVHSADSDVRGLGSLIAGRCRPSKGELVYPTGRDVAGDLGRSLESVGFAVLQTALYEARGAEKLPEPAANALHTRTATAMALFSVRNGLEFARLILAAGREDAVSELSVCCISESVAAAFGNERRLPAARRTVVAASPDADAVATALGALRLA
ncbi:MAG: uroporphyrinogen-III synthase [Rhodospirillaceae bacterium]|nr:uroporphyrinogen-III synthase [Rhodospirillaceae bacterium]MDE0617689.1 uroporphyrinogen-III synthase [Rhodospirillaceae bacterium]